MSNYKVMRVNGVFVVVNTESQEEPTEVTTFEQALALVLSNQSA